MFDNWGYSYVTTGEKTSTSSTLSTVPKAYIFEKLQSAVHGYLGLRNLFLCCTRCRLCLSVASLRLKFERKKKNARDKKRKKNNDMLPSSSCSPPSAHNPPQKADDADCKVQCY